MCLSIGLYNVKIDPNLFLIIGGFTFIVLIFIVLIVYEYFNIPFQYPAFKCSIDLSGKRQPSYEEYIDDWIINLDGHGRKAIEIFDNTIDEWDFECKQYLSRTWLLKKHKLEIYNEMKRIVTQRDYNFFVFEFYREQTRYRQTNYMKKSYKVKNVDNTIYLSLSQLLEIDYELEEIDYETSREQYYTKNQRRLMTKELRQKIIERDNYTCQNCGKYMPDEVGLHVDHIIPVKKGGKSVESNLQVLCDKCNLHKGKN